MEAASKSPTIPSNKLGEETRAPLLDQGFQTFLEKPVIEPRIDNSAEKSVIAAPAAPQTVPLPRDATLEFTVKGLVALDMMLLAIGLLVALGHPGPFQWIQVVVCSALATLGAMSSILAVFLAGPTAPGQVQGKRTATPSNAGPRFKSTYPRSDARTK